VSLEYGFEPQDSLVVIRGADAVTMAARLAIVEKIVADSSLPSNSSVLIDVVEVDRENESPDIEAYTDLVRKLRARFHGRIAIVNSAVGHTLVSYLVALAMDDSNVRAFVSQHDARPWLLGVRENAWS
jgi:hypothetical protein